MPSKEPYYPPARHRIEVCANCLAVHASNPLRTPKLCCPEPVLYVYRRLDDAPRCLSAPLRAHPAQLTFEPDTMRIGRCAWCGEAHADGPEFCDADYPDDADGWVKPGGRGK